MNIKIRQRVLQKCMMIELMNCKLELKILKFKNNNIKIQLINYNKIQIKIMNLLLDKQKVIMNKL